MPRGTWKVGLSRGALPADQPRYRALSGGRWESGLVSTRIEHGCIDCGLCVDVCPNLAISAGVSIHEIDPQRCTECVGFYAEEQCAVVCPVDVCLPDGDRIETEDELLERARKLHPKHAIGLELTPATSRFRRGGA